MSLKISIWYSPPAVTRCALDRICRHRGYLVEAARLGCDWLNLNCTFIWNNETDYGDVTENGTGFGLIGAIQRGEFDTAIPILTPTYNRFRAISFSETYNVNELVLLTRAPSRALHGQDISWNLVFAFSLTVWIAYVASLGLTTLAICKSLGVPRKNLMGSFFESGTSLIMNKFHERFLKRTATRLVFAAWILGCVVLGGSYTSALFSQTVIVRRSLPFTDLETFVQCLEISKCRIITHTQTASYIQAFLTLEDGVGARIRASLKKNPMLIKPIDEIAPAILREKKQYLVSIGPKITRLAWIDGNRGCRFYIMDTGFLESNAFPVGKCNSEYLHQLNKVALVLRETGLEQALRKRYHAMVLCDEKWNSRKLSAFLHSNLFHSLFTLFVFLWMWYDGGWLCYVRGSVT